MINFYNFVPDNDTPITRVIVDNLFPDKLTLYWELNSRFRDPEPYTFRVETNEDFNDEKSWVDTGYGVVNKLTISIPPYPEGGKVHRKGYRIKLITSKGAYYSNPVTVGWEITKKQWLHIRAAARKLGLYSRKHLKGCLYKRKWFGPRCPCRDDVTEDIGDTTCLQCYGTGIVGGYWKAWDGYLIDISPPVMMERRDPHFGRGTTDPQVVSAVIVTSVPVDAEDIWIRTTGDKRYYIRAVRGRTELGGVVFSATLELGTASYTDIIYRLPVD